MVVMFLRPKFPMRIALALLLTVAPVTAAAAQSESVIVNSMGVVGGSQVLIDPATNQPRAAGGLLQPWQYDEKPIHLHMPRKHKQTSETAPAAAPVIKPHKTAEAVSPPPDYTPPPKPKKVKAAAAAPVQAPAPVQAKPKAAPASGPIAGFDDLQTLTMTPARPAAPPARQAAAPQAVRQAPAPKPVEPPKPVKQASIAPAKPNAKPNMATPKDTIVFAANASDPSGSAVATARSLAASLSSALGDSTRVQLMAYAGARGEKTSDTRRLSLKRALVVRQLLIDDGIPSEKIDVYALGGSDDGGPLDRVDVVVKH